MCIVSKRNAVGLKKGEKMNSESAVVVFTITKQNFQTDLEIPLDISANDLVIALNSAYSLGINLSDINNCYLKCERPIALLKGNKTLADFGVRNGSEIFYLE